MEVAGGGGGDPPTRQKRRYRKRGTAVEADPADIAEQKRLRAQRERDRSARIVTQIQQLKELLHASGVEVTKDTKQAVLTCAAEYIAELQRTSRGLEVQVQQRGRGTREHGASNSHSKNIPPHPSLPPFSFDVVQIGRVAATIAPRGAPGAFSSIGSNLSGGSGGSSSSSSSSSGGSGSPGSGGRGGVANAVARAGAVAGDPGRLSFFHQMEDATSQVRPALFTAPIYLGLYLSFT